MKHIYGTRFTELNKYDCIDKSIAWIVYDSYGGLNANNDFFLLNNKENTLSFGDLHRYQWKRNTWIQRDQSHHFLFILAFKNINFLFIFYLLNDIHYLNSKLCKKNYAIFDIRWL